MEKRLDKKEKKVIEEINLDDVDVLEESVTPGGLGFDCSYDGYLGFGC